MATKTREQQQIEALQTSLRFRGFHSLGLQIQRSTLTTTAHIMEGSTVLASRTAYSVSGAVRALREALRAGELAL